mmetsp:Transcript_19087/g.36984  ORF Transcript_19087/g.36984 Transcript_19087/m.36984 type:complete len:281 (+) Transcript_19087:600-1442(+)
MHGNHIRRRQEGTIPRSLKAHIPFHFESKGGRLLDQTLLLREIQFGLLVQRLEVFPREVDAPHELVECAIVLRFLLRCGTVVVRREDRAGRDSLLVRSLPQQDVSSLVVVESDLMPPFLHARRQAPLPLLLVRLFVEADGDVFDGRRDVQKVPRLPVFLHFGEEKRLVDGHHLPQPKLLRESNIVGSIKKHIVEQEELPIHQRARFGNLLHLLAHDELPMWCNQLHVAVEEPLDLRELLRFFARRYRAVDVSGHLFDDIQVFLEPGIGGVARVGVLDQRL